MKTDREIINGICMSVNKDVDKNDIDFYLFLQVLML